MAVGLVVLGLALLSAGWLAIRCAQARDHLETAAHLVVRLRQQTEEGQTRAAAGTLSQLQEETHSARHTVADPVWRLAVHLPWVGDDLSAVTVVAETVDDVASQGLPPVVAAATDLDPAALAPRGGRVDLRAIESAAPRVMAADAVMIGARDRLAAVDRSGLLPPVASAVRQLDGELGDAARGTAVAARAAALLPPMLGRDGPRTYLVVFQNLAEVRATGGEFGAFAVVRTDGGTIRMVDQGTASGDLGTFERPVLPLDPAARALYTDRLGTFPADVNFSPHFPTAAALIREMYRRRSGQTVDGVLAVDPVALSYLLRATGPVPVPQGGMITSGSAARVLLAETYAKARSNEEKDRFFAGTARAVFAAAMTGKVDPRRAMTALATAAGERRVLLWSAHAEEQRRLSGTVLEGALPADDKARPVVGVFLNDGTGAKLDYYLRQSVRLTAGRCHADHRRELRVLVTLRSDAPASGLPRYVLGLGLGGSPGTIRTNVLVFSPTGGAIVAARVDGAAMPIGTGIERGRAVGVVPVDLRPGTSVTVDLTVLSGELPPAASTVPTARLRSLLSATRCAGTTTSARSLNTTSEKMSSWPS